MRLIAGSGRSGTTWVQDALATANRLRPVFEPLHPYVSELGDRYAHRALAADESHIELRQFLEDVCAGRCNLLWTKYRQQARWLFPPPTEFRSKSDAGQVYRHWAKFLREFPKLTIAGWRRVPLMKCIRANLMLGWLSRQCDFRIVLIVRHPGAVIESELRGRWNAKFALDRFRRDVKLHDLTDGRYRRLLERRLSPLEALATRWLIENQWVIERAQSNLVTVVFYEQLKASPDREWLRICQSLDLPRTPAAAILARPSQQSSPGRSAATVGAKDVPRWQRALSQEQVATIQGVLDEAQCTLYHMNDPLPRYMLDRTPWGASAGAAL